MPDDPFADVVIEQEAGDSRMVGELIAALDADLLARYPGYGEWEDGEDHDHVTLEQRRAMTFFVAWRGWQPLGCGALRVLADGVGEVKRMYVIPAARPRPGPAILARIEDLAADLGLHSVLRPPPAEAIALQRPASLWPLETPGALLRQAGVAILPSVGAPARPGRQHAARTCRNWPRAEGALHARTRSGCGGPPDEGEPGQPSTIQCHRTSTSRVDGPPV